MKRRFVHDFDLHKEIEKVLLSYYRETGQVVQSIEVAPSYENEDMLVCFYVQINYE